MMTIQEFANRYDIKDLNTIHEWRHKGYIPGAKCIHDVWIIPDLARPPYTKARAKTTTAIYVSIVKACENRKSVFPALYKLDEREFQIYINNLKAMGLLSIVKEDGVNYYFSKPIARDYLLNENKLRRFIKEFITIAEKIPVKDVVKAIY
jgi:hypothetical protein